MLRFAEHVSGDMYKVKKFIEVSEQSETSETKTQGSSAMKQFGFLQSEGLEEMIEKS